MNKNKNYLECEIKYQINTWKESQRIINLLKINNFNYEYEQIEIDYVPDVKNFLCRKFGLLLRFRAIYGEKNDILLTLKIKKSRKKYKEDEEIQCFFSEKSNYTLKLINTHLKKHIKQILPEDIFSYTDIFSLKKYLFELGFTELRALIEKKRLLYRKGDTLVTFDEFPEEIGLFLEIETPSSCLLDKMIKLLAIKQSELIVDDYGEIIKKKKEKLEEKEQRTCIYDICSQQPEIMFHSGPTNTLSIIGDNIIDIPHRHRKFQEIYKNLKTIIPRYATSFSYFYEALLLFGCGTQANETFFLSLKKTNILVLVQGEFGQRLYNMIKQYHNVFMVTDLETIKNKLKNESFDWLVAVHHETSTGYCNDLKHLGNLAKKFNIKIFVDCVSSFGIEDINMYKQQIDVISGVSGKAIASTPGISFLIMKKKFLYNRSNFKKLYSSLSIASILPFHKENMCQHTPSAELFLRFFFAMKYHSHHGALFNQKRKKQMDQIIKAFEHLGIKPMAPLSQRAKANSTFIINDKDLLQRIITNTNNNNFSIYFPKIQKAIQLSVYGDISNVHINKLCQAIKMSAN